MSETENLRRRALSALFWSVLQTWGGRAVGLTVFVLLARLLTPAQFGIATSAFLVMTMLAMVAEFGFSDAIVQRPNLKPSEVTLPFYTAVVLSIILAVCAGLLSTNLAKWIDEDGIAPFIVTCAAITPLMTIALFQEAMYRRALQFRQLAIRTFAGIALGGAVGITMALAGFGTWALIVQFAVQTIVSLVWLWARPVWIPSRELDIGSFRSLSAFGLNVVSMRLVDFVTLRSIDVVILVVYGPAALGLFTVASRLYQLLLQLLQSSISNVALSTLSRVSHDTARLARLYERSSSISAMVGTPAFVGLAALAPEISQLLFGFRWSGVDQVMQPLLLIGGLHCIQFVNGAYLTAVGRPRILLHLVVLKALFVLPPLYFIRMETVAETATLFASTLLALTPFSFGAVLRVLSLRWSSLLKSIGGLVFSSYVAFGVVLLARAWLEFPDNMLARSAMLGLLFIAAYALSAATFAYRAASENVAFIRGALKR